MNNIHMHTSTPALNNFRLNIQCNWGQDWFSAMDTCIVIRWSECFVAINCQKKNVLFIFYRGSLLLREDLSSSDSNSNVVLICKYICNVSINLYTNIFFHFYCKENVHVWTYRSFGNKCNLTGFLIKVTEDWQENPFSKRKN